MKHLICLLFLPFVLGEDGPMLSLKTGEIQGHYMTSRKGDTFAAYKGIPYAEPPVGDLRWKPAVPKKAWEGVRNCTVHPPMCTQSNITGDGNGQEDCLYLNLYHPLNQNLTHLPVMVWIHGGGYAIGAGDDYGPEFLMDEGVIVVYINYRLGVLGFLSLDTPEYSGNQGIRDQVLALKWVRENLETEKVTIFGESAGSTSVEQHILSPQSEGLFRAAIGQSGSLGDNLIDRVFTRERALEQSKSLAIAANCFNGSEWSAKHVLNCLRNKNALELIQLAEGVAGYVAACNVDDISKDGPILPDMPEQLIKFGLFNKVPTIWGSNKGEGSCWFAGVMEQPSLLNRFDSTWAFDGPRFMFFRNPNKNGSDFGPHDVEYAMAARNYYFNGTVSQEKLTDFADLITDTLFLRSIHNTVLGMSDFVPVYQYLFTFRDETSWTSTPGPENLELGPTHFDDVPYLLTAPKYVDYEGWSQANLENSLRMCKMWANFARDLNPTPADEAGVKWERVFRDNHRYLDIGEELVFGMSPSYKGRMAFWDQITANVSLV